MADDKNYFAYKRQFPDTVSILNGRNLKVTDFAKDALFVVDTNVLLIPYGLRQESLKEIKRIYTQLLKKNKLFVSAHTLREFAVHRSPKISELFSEVDKALSNIPSISTLDYPILAELNADKHLIEFRKGFQDYIKPYKAILKDLQASINEWNWSDPLTELYSELFSQINILETQGVEADLAKEFEQRMKDGVPPGNRDAGKPLNAIGDFLIWKAILDLGKDKKANIALITDDEKNDWMLKGNKKSISTQFALVDEYNRHTSGQQFTCINFASFLNLQGAKEDVVAEVTEQSDVSISFNNYLRGKNALLQIKTLLRAYVDGFVPGNENFLPNQVIAPLVDELAAGSGGPYFDRVSERRYVLGQIIAVLNQFINDNYIVEFEVYRAKRSTNERQASALRHAQQVLELIEKLLILMY